MTGTYQRDAFFWVGADEPGDEVWAQLAPGRFVNRIAASAVLTRRDLLAALVRNARTRASARGVDVDVAMVPTFAMPDGYEDFVAAAGAGGTWVQRPRDGNIRDVADAVTDPTAVHRWWPWVCQERVSDVRISVTVALVRLDPVVIYSADPTSEAATMAAAVLLTARDALLAATLDATDHADACFQLFDFAFEIDADGRPSLVGCSSTAIDDAEEIAALVAATRDRHSDLPNRIGRFALVYPRSASRLAAFVTVLGASDAAAVSRADAPALHPVDDLQTWDLGDALAVYAPRQRAITILEGAALDAWHSLANAGAPIGDGLALRMHSAEWLEVGLVTENGTPLTPPVAAGSRRPQPRVRWNLERTYRYRGRDIVVTAPDLDVDAWTFAALSGMETFDEPDVVDDVIEITGGGGRWLVTSGHQSPWPCRDLRELGPAVRRALLRSASATADGLALVATALEIGDVAIIVAAPLATRSALAVEWAATGGVVLADDLVAVADDGRNARAASVGFEQEAETYGWVGDFPSLDDDRPLFFGVDGDYVHYWFAGAPDSRTRPIAAVILDDDAPEPTAATPITALHALLAAAAPGGLAPNAADALVALARDAQALSLDLGDPQRAVMAIRNNAAARSSRPRP